ncbi:glycoside hydrolase family 28 protein [Saccharicrinis fermentans]|uniref:Exo-poly-alpha-D-galacturonosidase n=1 Tax=Saccharicrinis fermentans DSM 9555 = JCM 21142 TaxID=869213 RepID=W7Y3I4_9BACT|nr:glycoside hydrolase family 28 protein [Saccharicrinis fermentans]GAF05430.1 exo-poly-alpha-D-galacturonosidase precursor [Saccharicrinis fermentans DSM 9555 = JCM 21142]
MKKLYNLIFIPYLFFLSCQTHPKKVNILDCGAIADSTTINSTFIQKAIDACNDAGGGTVIIPRGAFISGTVLLKDNVTLHLEKGAQLVGSKNPNDYITIDPFTDAVNQVRGKCLVGAENAHNIAITGEGTIVGRGQLLKKPALLKTMKDLGVDRSKLNDFANNRPFLIRLVKSTNINIQGVQLRQPAAWTLHIFQCKNILVDGIDIYSHAHRNNDGIDLDSSRDAIIRNCHIDSGDDAICIKSTSPMPTQDVMISNCHLKSDWGTIKFGTESMGDFKNITVDNCTIQDTRGGGIKILSMDGANIDSITISNITMDRVEMPIFIRLGERLRTYRNAPKQKVGSINNIVLRNIKAVVRDTAECRVNPPSGILITGTPQHRIGKVTLHNIDISLPGCGTKAQAKNQIAEDEKRYPEFSFFGVLPASNMFARHIEKLETQNLHFSHRAKDERNEIWMDDVIETTTEKAKQ